MSINKKQLLGTIPGSIIFNGQRKVEHIAIHYTEYNASFSNFEELDNQTIQSFHTPKDDLVQWYDIRGLHDTDLLHEFGQLFNLHPLILEDTADVHQRPKLEEYPDGIYLKIHALSYNAEMKSISKEDVSIYLGRGFVLSFQEKSEDLLSLVRNRIRDKRGRITNKGADYLFYALLDSMVDNYFMLIDALALDIQKLETRISENPNDKIKEEILRLKKLFMSVRKSIHPMREAVIKLTKFENQLISEGSLIFIRDIHDHLYQIIESIDTNRDLLSGLQDLYISEISLEMNKVMQVLTIITTIFVPLSFIVGLYGMNFEYIPE
ncbi:MAG: magnesium/cobalt transporter CorA, partial [Saprospiraceae bacterium]|nr:magnesium/cobalt transporter CorA [Saprospiraceae bacterium]